MMTQILEPIALSISSRGRIVEDMSVQARVAGQRSSRVVSCSSGELTIASYAHLWLINCCESDDGEDKLALAQLAASSPASSSLLVSTNALHFDGSHAPTALSSITSSPSLAVVCSPDGASAPRLDSCSHTKH